MDRESNDMETFQICIKETVSQKFSVVAQDVEKAIKIASEKYNDCEFVLEPGELISKQMANILPEEQSAEWIEF